MHRRYEALQSSYLRIVAILAVAMGSLNPVVAPPSATAQTTARPQSRLVPLLEPGAREQTRKAIKKGLDFLEGQQGESGQIRGPYRVATTSLAGLALLGSGVLPSEGEDERYARMLVTCVGYLLSLPTEPRGFLTEPEGGTETGSRMHGHCFAVLFLTQVSGSLPPERQEDVAAVIRKGISVIEKAQSREGGWWYTPRNVTRDEASVTICALQALRAADNIGFVVDHNRVAMAVDYVKKCQNRADGSFRYSISERERRTTFALSAAAVSTLNAAGVYESQELRRGLDYLRKTLSGYRGHPHRAVEKQFFYYGCLYASQTFFQENGPTWREWYPKIREHLLAKQAADGSWESCYGRAYATAVSLLILEIPLGYLPILQR